MFIDKLPASITMRLYLANNEVDSSSWKVLFSSSNKWLHPLFELEEFLSSCTIENHNNERIFDFGNGLKASSSDLFLHDKIIGRAAAFMILRMGISRIEADLASQLAITLLQDHSIQLNAHETINAIDCMTENLLKNYSDIEMAYTLLAERRKKISLH